MALCLRAIMNNNNIHSKYINQPSIKMRYQSHIIATMWAVATWYMEGQKHNYNGIAPSNINLDTGQGSAFLRVARVGTAH
jgi:hypothetical protein